MLKVYENYNLIISKDMCNDVLKKLQEFESERLIDFEDYTTSMDIECVIEIRCLTEMRQCKKVRKYLRSLQ